MYKIRLPELTEEELQWQNKHMRKVKKVKLNQIGLERVNQWWTKKGKERRNNAGDSGEKRGLQDCQILGTSWGTVVVHFFAIGRGGNYRRQQPLLVLMKT